MYKSGINRHTFWLQSNKQSFVMGLNFQLSNGLPLKLNTLTVDSSVLWSPIIHYRIK